jgi:hypothetical protein
MEEPYIYIASLHSVMSQLIRVRAELARNSGSGIRVDAQEYRCDTVEGLDQLLSDIRARRIDEIGITDGQLGARRLVINFSGA